VSQHEPDLQVSDAPTRSDWSPYETPRGSAAAHYAETHPLVPLGATEALSNTPTSKSVIVRLEPTHGTRTPHEPSHKPPRKENEQ
jgi:hypothetical protein